MPDWAPCVGIFLFQVDNIWSSTYAAPTQSDDILRPFSNLAADGAGAGVSSDSLPNNNEKGNIAPQSNHAKPRPCFRKNFKHRKNGRVVFGTRRNKVGTLQSDEREKKPTEEPKHNRKKNGRSRKYFRAKSEEKGGKKYGKIFRGMES